MDIVTYKKKQKIIEFLCSEKARPFSESSKSIAEAINIERGEAYATLLDLEKRGFINVINISSIYGIEIKAEVLPGLAGFLSFGGYLEEYRKEELNEQLVKSVIDTNDSVRKTNNKMWVITGLAALFAFSSAIIAWFQYSKSPDELIQPQLDSIHKSIHSLRVSQEHAIRHLQNALQKDTLNVKVSRGK